MLYPLSFKFFAIQLCNKNQDYLSYITSFDTDECHKLFIVRYKK